MNGKDWERIIRISGDLYTLTEYGKPVFGEKIISYMGKRARHWDPKRSKLAAAIMKGMDIMPLKPDSKVLYLGASTGTTVSYLSDICINGRIFAVEVSFESFYKLLSLSEKRKNIERISSFQIYKIVCLIIRRKVIPPYNTEILQA